MTNKLEPVAYIDQPPVEGHESQIKQRWENDVTTNFSYSVIHARFLGTRKSIPLNYILGYTQVDRDQIESPEEGVIIRNITTNLLNVYLNGAWMAISVVPA